jgi:hypothetical protein
MTFEHLMKLILSLIKTAAATEPQEYFDKNFRHVIKLILRNHQWHRR